MKRLPKTIKILGTIYAIKLVKDFGKATNHDGEVDLCTKIITIEKKLVTKRRWEVLYHEIGHAFSHESGLGETLEPQAEEMFAQSFSAQLMYLFHKS